MRIAVDARSLSTRPTGVGHFLLAALNAWTSLDPSPEFLLLSHRPLDPAAEQALQPSSRLSFRHCPGRIFPGNGLVWLNTEYERQANALGATHLWGAGGVMPAWRQSNAKRILTVHDLVFRSLPWTMSWRARLAYTLLAGRAIRDADLLWCVSEFTAREVRKHYPKRRATDITCGSGLNPMRQQMTLPASEESALLQRYRVDDKTLLFVGTLEPRKNLAFLLGLMPRLNDLGFSLLVVGCSGWGKDEIASVVNGKRFPRQAVQFCDYLSDAALQTLYKHCAFFVSASLMEGFGLPQLEAMSAGCPVIAAANSAVVEVVANGGMLIDGWSPDHWVNQIQLAFRHRDELSKAALSAAAVHVMSDACRKIDAAIRDKLPT
ncbi:glycosyltransferase family 1 protein [Paucibacter sp. APW11]|uniref:Glycosyltransferase family 1 protein n=1 Tax=Roseateles aquae TaxID=3077235 RepID=A0ABU3PFI3_9BURK|nr:glycosyltransferase family 1 protein [Paucibacter sp. APW11]MDT9001259.1 glycosyltransferase family 1 protein [Paucibacter sp. APW11]